METQNKTYPDLVVTVSNQAKESYPEPGLTRRVLAYNDKLFLAEHRMAKGWGWSDAQPSARSGRLRCAGTPESELPGKKVSNCAQGTLSRYAAACSTALPRSRIRL